MDRAPGIPKEVWVVIAAQFGLAFSVNYVIVFLPFYINAISPLPESETLVWTGLIIGAAPAAASIASTLWGMLTARFSPKLLFERGLLTHSLIVAAVAFTTSLPALVLLRLLQGMLGGISTIALIIISAVSRREALAAHIGLLNSAMTTGALVGPPIGAAIAAAAGFRAAFLSAGLVIAVTLVLCHRLLPPVSPQRSAVGAPRVSRRELVADWLVSVTAMIQLVFLPSVLPQVIAGFGIAQERAVVTAGLVVTAYGAAAAVGAASLRWIGQLPHRRAVLAAGVASALLQGALALATGLAGFVVLRVLQAFLAGLVMPLLMADVAATGRGGAVGVLNSARFAGNALGPIVATTLLARADLTTLYLTISAVALASLAVFAVARAAGPEPARQCTRNGGRQP